MVKDKERSVNPAQAQRRAEKQKALKKSKAELQARRNEKLARRNPQRLQRQIDDLKDTEKESGQLKPQQKQVLEGLERDLRAVQKAREALGDKAPTFGRYDNDGGSKHGQRRDGDHGRGVLGKRRRDGDGRGRRWGGRESSGSETDESVRRIPMPRDTPPPIPRQQHTHRRREGPAAVPGQPHALPPKPEVVETKTVYESAPQIRNLREEAVNKFVPAAVRVKQQAVKGEGGLVEPEEMDRLEQAGYMAKPAERSQDVASGHAATPTANTGRPSLEEEEERFNRELKSVQIEEVTDEDL